MSRQNDNRPETGKSQGDENNEKSVCEESIHRGASGVKRNDSEMPGGDFMCPRWVSVLRISPGARLLWINLRARCGKKDHCWPSVETLAADLGFKRSSIKYFRRELVEHGLLHVSEREGKSTRFFPLWPDQQPSQQADRDGGQHSDRVTSNSVNQVTGGGQQADRGVVNTVTTEVRVIEERQKKEKSTLPSEECEGAPTETPATTPKADDAYGPEQPKPKTPKSKQSKSGEPKEPKPTTIVIRAFYEGFERKFNIPFRVPNSDGAALKKQSSQIKALVDSGYSTEILLRCVNLFFDSTDGWWVEKGAYNIGAFCSAINDLVPKIGNTPAPYAQDDLLSETIEYLRVRWVEAWERERGPLTVRPGQEKEITSLIKVHGAGMVCKAWDNACFNMPNVQSPVGYFLSGFNQTVKDLDDMPQAARGSVSGLREYTFFKAYYGMRASGKPPELLSQFEEPPQGSCRKEENLKRLQAHFKGLDIPNLYKIRLEKLARSEKPNSVTDFGDWLKANLSGFPDEIATWCQELETRCPEVIKRREGKTRKPPPF